MSSFRTRPQEISPDSFVARITKSKLTSEKSMARVSDLQQLIAQLQQEKDQAVRELEEVKKSPDGDALGKIRSLQREVEKAKESERKMLESMISQTRQLESTKRELEEAKLEIRNLKEREFDPDQLQYQSSKDMLMLRSELKLALEAEENNKKAMDDLAITLKEVNSERNALKGELDRARAEADYSKSMWMMAEEKSQILMEEVERLRMEAEEAKRTAKEESLRFRDIIKQAVSENTVVQESLEITRKENSQLKDLVTARENSLKTMKQELECIKLKEANANDRIKELKEVLEEDSSAVVKKRIPMKFPSERWRSDSPQIQNGLRGAGAIDQGLVRDRASLSCSSDLTGISRLGFQNGNDYGHLEKSYLDEVAEGDSPAKQRKKKQLLQRFGDLLRRGRHAK